MDKYLNTDNAKLLRNILERKLLDKGLSEKDNHNNKYFESITRDNKGPRNILINAIDLYKDSVREYIKIKGALCKGELKTVSSSLLNIPAWRINQYILERHIKEKKFLDLKELLLEDKVRYEKLCGLIKKIDIPDIIAYKLVYKDVTESKNIVWFTDINKALKYVENFLITPIKYKKIEKLKTKKFRERVEKKEIIIPKITINKEEFNIITPTEFVKKYNLDDNFYKKNQSAILNEDIERTLTIGGLYNEDLRDIKRRIHRIPQFSDILKISGSNNYSREKILQIARFFSRANSTERKELLEDISSAFKCKDF